MGIEEIIATISAASSKTSAAIGAIQQALQQVEESKAMLATAVGGSNTHEIQQALQVYERACLDLSEAQKSLHWATDTVEGYLGRL